MPPIYAPVAALRPGDRVAVVAPSGPPPPAALDAGLAILRGRYDVVEAPGLRARTGFLAGPDEARAAALEEALADPSVRAVWCARGGHGALRLLPRLERAARALAADPKPLVGFSDVTALHGWALVAGHRTAHGPVVTQLPTLSAADHAAAFALLESPAPPPPIDGLRPLVGGRARGPLVGGTLEVLSRLIGTPFLPDLSGAILLLEEVDERPYRIDRLLVHLELAGLLGRVAALLVGDLTRCEDPPTVPHPVAAAEVAAERLGRLAVPVALGAPIGHGERNRAVPLGAEVELDAGAGRLTFFEGLVA